MKRKNYFLTLTFFFILLYLAFFLIQCNQVNLFPILSEDPLSPSILSYTPVNNAINVPLDSTIQVAFSEEMDTEATEFAFKLYKQTSEGEELVDGLISWEENDTKLLYTPQYNTINPEQTLGKITTYRISISEAAKDKNGNALDYPGTSLFTTIGEILPSAGRDHTLILKKDGIIWSWGNNSSGQCGRGPDQPGELHTPGIVLDLENVSSISAGGFHNIALTNEGYVYTWGTNNNDVLGYTQASSQPVPKKVENIGNIVAVSAGYNHTVVIVEEDDTTHVYTWGVINAGKLGNGVIGTGSTPDPQIVVTAVDTPLIDITSVAAGHVHTLALDTQGRVWGWGSNDNKILGGSDSLEVKEFAELIPLGVTEKVVKIAAGKSHSVALLENGKVVTWGANDRGQLGSNRQSDEDFTPPEFVKLGNGSELTNIIDISTSCYSDSTFALSGDGLLWAWGFNIAGQLGNGKEGIDEKEIYAIQANLQSSISYIAMGRIHGVAINNEGKMFGWGSNSYGQTGINDSEINTVLTPEEVFDCEE